MKECMNPLQKVMHPSHIRPWEYLEVDFWWVTDAWSQLASTYMS